VKGAKRTFWAAYGIMILISFALGIVLGITEYFSLDFMEVIINVIAQIITFILSMGILYIGIQRAKDLPINYRMMFYALKSRIFINIIGVFLLKILILLPFGILVAISTLLFQQQIITSFLLALTLFIIASCFLIYFMLRMSVTTGMVLDKNVNCWRAIVLSFQATRSNCWRLLGLLIVEFFIIFVSMLPLLIGLIWTLPLMWICYGLMYHRLSVNADSK
jgi:hypothetical protein